MNHKLQNMNVFTSQHTWDTNSHLLLSQQDQKHSKPLSTLARKPLTAIAMLNIPSVSAMADRPFIGVCAINSYYVFCLWLGQWSSISSVQKADWFASFWTSLCESFLVLSRVFLFFFSLFPFLFLLPLFCWAFSYHLLLPLLFSCFCFRIAEFSMLVRTQAALTHFNVSVLGVPVGCVRMCVRMDIGGEDVSWNEYVRECTAPLGHNGWHVLFPGRGTCSWKAIHEVLDIGETGRHRDCRWRGNCRSCRQQERYCSWDSGWRGSHCGCGCWESHCSCGQRGGSWDCGRRGSHHSCGQWESHHSHGQTMSRWGCGWRRSCWGCGWRRSHCSYWWRGSHGDSGQRYVKQID